MKTNDQERLGPESRFEEALLNGGTRRLIMTPELAQDPSTAIPIATHSQRGRAPRMSISWSVDKFSWVHDKPWNRNVRSNEERTHNMTTGSGFFGRSALSPDTKCSSPAENGLAGQASPMFRPYISPTLTADSGNSLKEGLSCSHLPTTPGQASGWQGPEVGSMDTSYFPMGAFSPASMSMKAKVPIVGPETNAELQTLSARPAARVCFSPEELPMLSDPVFSGSLTDVSRRTESLFPMETVKEEPTISHSPLYESPEEFAQYCWNQDTRFMDLSQMATHLGGDEPLATQARRIFMKLFDLRQCTVVDALRLLSSRLYLNAETSRIDNLLQALSEEYIRANPASIFYNKENIHNVLFALFLLNTDLHVAEVATKMSQCDFIQNASSTLKPEAIQSKTEVIVALQQMYGCIRSNMLEPPSSIKRECISMVKRPNLQRKLSLGLEDARHKIFAQGDSPQKFQRQGSLLRLPSKNQRRSSASSILVASSHEAKGLSESVQYQAFKNTESVHGPSKSQPTYHAALEDDSIVLKREAPSKDTVSTLTKLSLVHSITKRHTESEQPAVSVTLHDDTIHVLYMDASHVDAWVSACNEVAARCTRVPMLEGSSNCDYGWLKVQQKQTTLNTTSHLNKPTTLQKGWWSRWFSDSQVVFPEDVKLQEWYPPPISLEPSHAPREEQAFKMYRYIGYLRQEVQAHAGLRAPMEGLWAQNERAFVKATTNWERRRTFLATQLEKFEIYVNTLT